MDTFLGWHVSTQGWGDCNWRPNLLWKAIVNSPDAFETAKWSSSIAFFFNAISRNDDWNGSLCPSTAAKAFLESFYLGAMMGTGMGDTCQPKVCGHVQLTAHFIDWRFNYTPENEESWIFCIIFVQLICSLVPACLIEPFLTVLQMSPQCSKVIRTQGPSSSSPFIWNQQVVVESRE
jgi:hypothetical protein